MRLADGVILIQVIFSFNEEIPSAGMSVVTYHYKCQNFELASAWLRILQDDCDAKFCVASKW